MEACVTSPDWLNKFHSFFSASFLLAKESETFIFLGIFCNLLVQSFLNFQSRVGWLFRENNPKWPKVKLCFDIFDSNDTFDTFEIIASWEKSDMPVRKNRLFFLKKQISLCQAKIDERRNVCHGKWWKWIFQKAWVFCYLDSCHGKSIQIINNWRCTWKNIH